MSLKLSPAYAHEPGSLDAYPIGDAPGESEAFSAAVVAMTERPYRWTNGSALHARPEHLYPIRYPMSFVRMDLDP